LPPLLVLSIDGCIKPVSIREIFIRNLGETAYTLKRALLIKIFRYRSIPNDGYLALASA